MLGKTFITKVDLYFKYFEIPKGTKFEIIETNINWGEDKNAVKVCFYCEEYDHEEVIQIMSLEEIKEISE